jgi:site-specific recombinase XerD
MQLTLVGERARLSLRFQQYLDAYEAEHLPARNYTAETRAIYAAEVGFFLVFVEKVGLKDLKQVERRHVEGYLAQLDRKDYAVATRRRKLSVIKSFFSWLAVTKIIAADPAADIIPPRLQWKRPRVLTKSEYRRLLAVIDEPRDLALMQLLLQTGMHLAEAHRLNLADVSLPKPVTDESVGVARILDRPQESQITYLNATACRALSAWLLDRPAVATDAVFVSRNQNRLSRRQMQRLMINYIQEAGLSHATIKALRYSFATHHLIQGTPLKQVQECLGIKLLRSTEVYVEVAQSLKAQYMQANSL